MLPGISATSTYSLLHRQIPKISIRWPTDSVNACVGAPCETCLAAKQVEAGTPFGRWHDAGRLKLPTDDEGAAMYSDASRMLLEVLPFFPPTPLGTFAVILHTVLVHGAVCLRPRSACVLFS